MFANGSFASWPGYGRPRFFTPSFYYLECFFDDLFERSCSYSVLRPKQTNFLTFAPTHLSVKVFSWPAMCHLHVSPLSMSFPCFLPWKTKKTFSIKACSNCRRPHSLSMWNSPRATLRNIRASGAPGSPSTRRLDMLSQRLAVWQSPFCLWRARHRQIIYFFFFSNRLCFT